MILWLVWYKLKTIQKTRCETEADYNRIEIDPCHVTRVVEILQLHKYAAPYNFNNDSLTHNFCGAECVKLILLMKSHGAGSHNNECSLLSV